MSTTTTTVQAPAALWSKTSTPLIETATRFLKSYETLSAMALCSHLGPSFTHTVLPTSLGLPARGLTDFQSHAKKMFQLFRTFTMLPQSINADEKNRTVVVHVKMGGDVAMQGLGVDEWWNEGVMFIDVGEDGKVVAVREFVDSAKGMELRGRLAKVGERTLES